jgi:hypothetical protein
VILVSPILANPSMEGHVEGIHIAMPAIDTVIDTNAYDPDHVFSTAYGIYNDYYTVDDFTAIASCPKELIFWTITTNVNPANVDVYFWADNAPGPGEVLFTENVSGSNLIFTDSGVTFAGYTIYILEASLIAYFYPSPGSTYWTTVQRNDGYTLYAMMDDEISGYECWRNIGSGWFPGSILGYCATDMFRIIYGWGTPLSRNTWGAIKTQF